MTLKIKDLVAGYGNIDILHGISLDVDEGAYVSVVGANGAGKSTLLKTISGIVKTRSGEINFFDKKISDLTSYKVPMEGIAHVPEGRQVFAEMSVVDNLMAGAWLVKDKDQRQENLEEVYTLFPRLKERSEQLAGTLSGGEQQMVAVGRALMLKPRLIMLDEPSQGLAPKVVSEMYEQLQKVRELGTSILLIEQNTTVALKYSDYAYVLEQGKITLSGDSKELQGRDEIRQAYLGL